MNLINSKKAHKALLIFIMSAYPLVLSCLRSNDPAHSSDDNKEQTSPSTENAISEQLSCELAAEFFTENFYPAVKSQCSRCHSSSSIPLNWTRAESNDPEALFVALKQYYELSPDSRSKLVDKPLHRVDHGGALQFDSAEAKENWQRFVPMLDCRNSDPADLESSEGNSEQLSPMELLHKAAMRLARRRPSPQEIDSLQEGMPFSEIVEAMASEEGFFKQVKLWYADQLLTDGLINSEKLTDIPNEIHFQSKNWFTDTTKYGPEIEKHKLCSWQGFVREPVELIAYVVRKNRPFTEILTADYTMVNYCSARSYGVEGDVIFERTEDPTEFQPARLVTNRDTDLEKPYPHAGIFTTVGFNRRYPHAPGNLNRSKANATFKFLFGIDIGKLTGVGPIGSDDPEATIANPKCTTCHDLMDPVARLYRDFTDNTTLTRFDKPIFDQMKPAGFFYNALPEEFDETPLSWLAEKSSHDPRFARQVAKVFFAGITGRSFFGNPAREPSSRENQFITKLGQQLLDSGYSVRQLIPAIVNSEFFNTKHCLSSKCMAGDGNTGLDSVLPPELLDEKLYAVTGMHWRDEPGGKRLLQSINEGSLYRYYQSQIGMMNPVMGGSDFKRSPRRNLDANKLYVAALSRMALQMGCKIPSQEFARKDRFIFDGYYLDELEEAVSKTGRLPDKTVLALVERVAKRFSSQASRAQRQDDIRIMTELFNKTMERGLARLQSKEENPSLPKDCTAEKDHETGEDFAEPISQDPFYVLRSLSSIISLALMDDHFLTE